jgi:hypothetical protein
MCDIWFTKYHNQNEGGYAQFMPIQATDDGLAETTTNRQRFYIIKVPGISKDHPMIAKLFQAHYGASAEAESPVIARRRWVLRGADLPKRAKQLFQKNGVVTVKAGKYEGEYDYTWPQVKGFFRDNLLNADMSDEL